MTEPEIIKPVLDEISKFLKENPLETTTWDLISFFENKRNVNVADSKLSLRQLNENRPHLNEKLADPTNELQKIILLLVQNVMNIPVSAISNILREVGLLAEILPSLPMFPLQPAYNIADFYCKQFGEETEGYTDADNLEKFKEVSDCNSIVYELILGWKEEVTNYVTQLEAFSLKFGPELSTQQKEVIRSKLARSNAILVSLEERIELKKNKVAEEQTEYEQFYKIVSRDEMFQDDSHLNRQKKIKEMYDKSSKAVIRAVLRGNDSSCNERNSDSASRPAVVRRKSNWADDRASTSMSEEPTVPNNKQAGQAKKAAVRNKENINKRSLTEEAKKNDPEVAPLSAKRVRTKPKRFDDGIENNGTPKLRAISNSNFKNSDNEEGDKKKKHIEKDDSYSSNSTISE